MDHEEVGDCRYLGRCPAYRDGLIDSASKGPEGRGCTGQNDLYRGKHCKTFGCSYLIDVLRDALRQPAPKATG